MYSFVSKYFFYYPATFIRRQWVPKYLRQLRKSQWLDYDHLKHVQVRKLVRLLEHAKVNIPYYQEALGGVDLNSITSLNDLHKIPILTKELIKENFTQLLHPKERGALKKTTGGSIGNPVTIYQSAASVGAVDAAYWRGYEWAGVKICDRQGRFWGMPYDKKAIRVTVLKDFIMNRLRCSAFSFDEKDMEDYHNKLNRFKPKYLYGYVSMLEAFGKYLLENNLKLKFQPTCVITTSEALTIPHRRLFEKVFRCKVYNEYGCGEVGTIAHECECGSMHISAENLIVEILHEGKPVNCAEKGDIVVTELNNKAMPLIRYNLKDIGYLSSDSCSCGRGLPVLGGVVGRAYDIIYNKEGKAFHGEYFMYIFEELQNIGIHITAFTVIQEDYDNFTIKVVMGENGRNKLENYINKRVHDSYGEYAIIGYEYVSDIEREKSGKIRLIKSFIANKKSYRDSGNQSF